MPVNRQITLAARPVGYRQTQRREATYASRTMVWSGPILALFVVYHILHFTTGTVHPSFESDYGKLHERIRGSTAVFSAAEAAITTGSVRTATPAQGGDTA